MVSDGVVLVRLNPKLNGEKRMSIVRFSTTTVAAFVLYGVLYNVGITVLFPGVFESMAGATVDPGDNMLPTMSYHLVQTVAVVWLFDKAVGSSDLKAGALFGFMMGVYLMATDSIWFTNLKDFPQDGHIVLSVMHLVVGAIIGMVLAKAYGFGRGGEAKEADV